MAKLFGLLLLVLGIIVLAGVSLSVFELITTYDTPSSAYGAGYITGRIVGVLMFGYLGYYMFRKGKDKLSNQSDE